VITYQDVAYAPEHGERGLLDIFMPGASSGVPVVLVIHGGGLRDFSKERMANVCSFLAQHGWAAAAINYRLLPQHPFPAQLEDTRAALWWLKTASHPALRSCDRARTALLGASAGAYLALAAGFLAGVSQVRAVVSISGPALPGWYGSLPADQAGSPLLHAPIDLIHPDTPPVLAVHSRNDRLVPPDQSIELVNRLRLKRLDARLYLFDGEGQQHGIWKDPAVNPPRLCEDIEGEIFQFLKERL
jgi:acetyl esterase/lipase